MAEEPADLRPRRLHPLPRGLVELYGLLAVLFVLVPEWMAGGGPVRLPGGARGLRPTPALRGLEPPAGTPPGHAESGGATPAGPLRTPPGLWRLSPGSAHGPPAAATAETREGFRQEGVGAVITSFSRGVAQLGSAPLWGSGGRRFKSCRSDFAGLKPTECRPFPRRLFLWLRWRVGGEAQRSRVAV